MTILSTNCVVYTLVAYYGTIVLFCVIYNTHRIVKIMWRACRATVRVCAWLVRKIKKKAQPMPEANTANELLLLQKLRPDNTYIDFEYNNEYADFQSDNRH